MGAVIALLESPLGKIVGYALSILVGAGALTGLYILWKHEIQQEALAKYNQTQLEKSLSDAQKQLAEMDRLLKLTQQSMTDLRNQTDALDSSLAGIDKSIDSAKDDGPASPIITDTLSKLGAPR